LRTVTGPKKLAIDFKKREGMLIVSITDNGVGIDHVRPEKRGNGKALEFISKRLALLSRAKGAKQYGLQLIDLKSAESADQGTQCILTIPFITTNLTNQPNEIIYSDNS